jgi:hypothetical protein
MGVPERQLLAAMGHTEGVVDVDRRHRGAELPISLFRRQ